MARKGFSVQITLDIHAVTCPGVWLCPNGDVSLQLYLLNSSLQTPYFRPSFPIKCHERYVFNETFYSKHSLAELQRVLNKEILYIELVQWESCNSGNVLATFRTTLKELLYPSFQDGAEAGTDVDLLMDPAKNFPGIIAPKIEVSTISKIEEIVQNVGESPICGNKRRNLVNHKVITSYKIPKRNRNFHQKRVCHSNSFRNNWNFPKGECRRLPKKPPFVVRHCDEADLMRQPGFPVKYESDFFADPKSNCSFCKTKTDLTEETYEKSPERFDIHKKRRPIPSAHRIYHTPRKTSVQKKRSQQKIKQAWCENQNDGNEDEIQIAKDFSEPREKLCNCNSGHTLKNCHVCAKYAKYFEDKQQRSQYTLKSRKEKQKCCCAKNGTEISFENDCDGCCSRRNCEGKLSFAKKIHERLKETLNTAKNYPILSRCDSDFSDEDEDLNSNNRNKDACLCSYINSNCSKEDVKENIDKMYQRICRNVAPRTWCN